MVSHDFPFCIAHIDAPEPKWRAMIDISEGLRWRKVETERRIYESGRDGLSRRTCQDVGRLVRTTETVKPIFL